MVEIGDPKQKEDEVVAGGESLSNGTENVVPKVEEDAAPRDSVVESKTRETMASGEDDTAAENADEQQGKPKPSKLKVIWGKLGLDPVTLIMMFKGSLPPLIGVAFYQSADVAATYGNLGYLVPIVSILSLSILPRAKYIQTLFLNVLGVCFGSAIALLGIWSGIQARNNTSPAGSNAAYNSSQSAVCAIWLFANIWFSNLLRAKFVPLQFLVILYSIFTSVAFTFGARFHTIEQGEAFVKQLLQAFLTGLAISTGVSLLVFPVSSRKVVFGEMTGYIGVARKTIKAQSAYLQSLEKSDMFSLSNPDDAKVKEHHKKHDEKKKNADEPKNSGHPEAKALKAAVTALTELHGKLHGDLAFGKREFAYGKLGPDDLDEIFKLLRMILIPLIGMSTITEIFERVAERRGWVETKERSEFDSDEAWEQDPGLEAKNKEKRLWNDVMKELHEPFAIVSLAMDEGLEHAGILLELIKPPKTKKAAKTDPDVEAVGDAVKPGDAGFTDYLEKKVNDFYLKRGKALRCWAREKGLSVKEWDAANSAEIDGSKITRSETQHRRDQQQLYLILYMEFLLYSTGTGLLKLIQFAEKKVADGTMKRSRFIHPGQHRLRNWFTSMGTEDATVDSATPDSTEGAASSTIYMGAGFSKKKDPEHLPATTAWQKSSNLIRKIPHFLGSGESAFGFRVALATMTIGIVGFLENTQTFFIEQRLVWAMIMIAIGMTPTAGQSVFGFFIRVGGTVISTVTSIVIWYIVDQKVPGVIVMLWFFTFIEMYFFLKSPRFIPAWIICIVTQILIVDYEIQVQVIGVAASTSTGQPYYPIYELAPYRLATVAGGLLIAFIWTIFPYPLTDRSWLRRDLGATIYLLANYYSVVHSTIGSRVQHTEGDMENENSPGRQLEKVRHKIFGKLLLLLPSLHEHAEWQKWEPIIGGKFPKDTYESIIKRLTNILNYLSLMSYATHSFHLPATTPPGPASAEWLSTLSSLLRSINPTSHGITSILVLLSASISSGSALPPYMHTQLPEPYQLSRRLEELDSGILDARHVEEVGYSAYAVMQVASSLVMDDLRGLVGDVAKLVGEVDFSFRVEGVSVNALEEQGGKGKKE